MSTVDTSEIPLRYESSLLVMAQTPRMGKRVDRLEHLSVHPHTPWKTAQKVCLWRNP